MGESGRGGGARRWTSARGRGRALPLLVIMVATAVSGATAQTLLVSASHVDAVWRDGDDVRVQTSRSVHRFVPGEGGAPASRPTSMVEAPSDTVFLDVRHGRTLFVSATSWSGSGITGDTPLSPFFRAPPPHLPIRLPLLFGERGHVLPSAPKLLVQADGEARSKPHPFDAPVGGNLRCGWGIGDPMVVDRIMPYLVPVGFGDGREAMVVGLLDDWSIVGLAAPEKKLRKPPLDDEEGILGFPYSAAPAAGDLNGDGHDDLVVIDPSAGSVALYLDLLAAEPKPSRVMLVDGLCIEVHVGDGDGDGRDDLFLLRAQAPGLLGQLRVVQENRLAVEALFYRGRADGTLSASPDHRRRFDLPLRIGIDNELRSVARPGVLLWTRGPALCLVDPDGLLRRLSLEEHGDESEVARLPEGRSLPGATRVRCGAGHVFGWRTPGDDRVYWVPDGD